KSVVLPDCGSPMMPTVSAIPLSQSLSLRCALVALCAWTRRARGRSSISRGRRWGEEPAGATAPGGRAAATSAAVDWDAVGMLESRMATKYDTLRHSARIEQVKERA